MVRFRARIDIKDREIFTIVLQHVRIRHLHRSLVSARLRCSCMAGLSLALARTPSRTFAFRAGLVVRHLDISLSDPRLVDFCSEVWCRIISNEKRESL